MKKGMHGNKMIKYHKHPSLYQNQLFQKWFTIEYYKACNNGSYGMDCSGQCGHCSENVCDHISGICLSGCMAGYQGNLCKHVCLYICKSTVKLT